MTEESIDEVILNSKKSFPNAKSDTEALCLMITYLSGTVKERNDAWNKQLELYRKIEILEGKL